MSIKQKAFERWQRFGLYRCNHTDKLLVTLEDLAWKAGWSAYARAMKKESVRPKRCTCTRWGVPSGLCAFCQNQAKRKTKK